MENVSVIVPMFNCEKTINRLIESLVNQTYKNLEILLIDDGSTDNTVKICKKHCKNSKIKIIIQKHSGVSKARNNGIKNATGKYICFCDADDYIELNAIEKMVKACEKNNVEFVMSGYFINVYLKDGTQFVQKIVCNEKKYPSREDLKNNLVQLYDTPILQTVWSKLYITNIIKNNNIYFENYNFGEDVKFNEQYLLNISKAYNIGDYLYHYVKNEDNTLTERYINNLFEIRKNEHYELCDFFNKYGVDKKAYEEYVYRRHFNCLIRCVKNYAKVDCPLSFKYKVKEVKKIMNDPLTITCINNCKFKNKGIKLLAIMFKLKLATIVMIFFVTIKFIKLRMPWLFKFFRKKINM